MQKHVMKELNPMDRKRTASIALIVVLLACTIAIIAFVMGNGSTPIGPPTPVPGGGGLSSIIGEDDLTPISTFTTLNAGTGLQGVGGGDRFTLNVITPTPHVESIKWADIGYAEIPQTTQWIDGCTVACNYTTVTRANNVIYFNPIILADTLTITAIGVRVQTAVAGGTARIGMYQSSGIGEFPDGAPVIDEGTIDCTTIGSYTFTLGTPYVMAADEIFWLAFHGDCVNVVIYAHLANTTLKINDTTNNRDNNGLINLTSNIAYSSLSLPTLSSPTITRSSTVQSRIRLEIQ